MSKPNSTISDVVMQHANVDELTVRLVHGVNVARFCSSIRRTDSTAGTTTIIRCVARVTSSSTRTLPNVSQNIHSFWFPHPSWCRHADKHKQKNKSRGNSLERHIELFFLLRLTDSPRTSDRYDFKESPSQFRRSF